MGQAKKQSRDSDFIYSLDVQNYSPEKFHGWKKTNNMVLYRFGISTSKHDKSNRRTLLDNN